MERGVAREEKRGLVNRGVEIGVANGMEMVEECQSPFWPGIKAFPRALKSKRPLKSHSYPQTFAGNLPRGQGHTVTPGSPGSFQSLLTLSLTPRLTLRGKDPESRPASRWAPWTRNFNFSRSALAPTMRFCRLHPVSTVASPHPDFLSRPYQRPCPTTDARQALLKASWQVENSHTALPAHTSPSKALPWSRTPACFPAWSDLPLFPAGLTLLTLLHPEI